MTTERIPHATNPEVTVQMLAEDCEAAKERFAATDFCFTWATVQFLLDENKRLREALTYWLPKSEPLPDQHDPICRAHREHWHAARAALKESA